MYSWKSLNLLVAFALLKKGQASETALYNSATFDI